MEFVSYENHELSASVDSANGYGVRDLGCVYCYDTSLNPNGIYTSLKSWKSFSLNCLQFDVKSNRFYLHTKTTRKLRPLDSSINANSADLQNGNTSDPKSMKDFILNEPAFDSFHTYSVVVFDPNNSNKGSADSIVISVPYPTGDSLVDDSVSALLLHLESASSKPENDTSGILPDESLFVSRYADSLPQLPCVHPIPSDKSQWFCSACGKQENLWMNLSSGYIGCGRRNWDGSGGCGASLAHFKDTGEHFPLVVKLGSITATDADVHSYAKDEDDAVVDPKLAEHLSHWGIARQLMEKTEKSVAEMQVDLNKNYEFSRMTEAGKNLQRVSGLGLIGIQNLGNSCYMNAVLQMFAEVPSFVNFLRSYKNQLYSAKDPNAAENDLLVQFVKIIDALYSEQYVIPIVDESDEFKQSMMVENGVESKERKQLALEIQKDVIRPRQFKNVLGRGNHFGTGEQQDSLEFYQFLLDKLSREIRGMRMTSEQSQDSVVDPLNLFEFEVQERVECAASHQVRYVSRRENVLSLSIPLSAATNRDLVDEERKRATEQERKRPLEATNDDGCDDALKSSAFPLTKSTESEPLRLNVPFDACLESFSAAESVEDFYSTALKQKGLAYKTARLRTMPPYLVVHLRRYTIEANWTIKKLDAKVDPPSVLLLETLRAPSLPVAGEVLLPEDEPDVDMLNDTSVNANVNAEPQPSKVVADPSIVAELVGMGFSENGSIRAALATNNGGAEVGVNWILEHMGDDNFNDPIPEDHAVAAASSTNGENADSESIMMLTSMGFSESHAKAALIACNQNLEQAADWLFTRGDNLDAEVSAVLESATSAEPTENSNTAAFSDVPLNDGAGQYELVGSISHMGGNTSCGHYVAHVKKHQGWILFNDEKVAISEAPPLDSAYMFLYKRIE